MTDFKERALKAAITRQRRAALAAPTLAEKLVALALVKAAEKALRDYRLSKA